MKRVLIISPCSVRGNSTGVVGKFLRGFSELDKDEYVVDLCDTSYFEKHEPSKYSVNEYYGIKKNWLDRIIIRIPKLRSIVSVKKALTVINNAINNHYYDLIVVHSVPFYTYKIIELAHNKGSKTILVPWGANDIIDRPERDVKLQKAFDTTDFVRAIEGSNCAKTMQNRFKVPIEKCKFTKPFLRSIEEIKKAKKKYNRNECAKLLGMPLSSCYIICGYNAYPVMQHKFIIESIAEVKNLLPKDYVLVFPMTYPSNENYIKLIKDECSRFELNSVFFTHFLTNEQMACLHLLSNYFINIQHADSGNAFQIEELYCGSQTITGKWLNYSHFETYGTPYYKMEKLENLPSLLKDIFTKKLSPIKVPDKLIKSYEIPEGFKRAGYWKELIDSL